MNASAGSAPPPVEPSNQREAPASGASIGGGWRHSARALNWRPFLVWSPVPALLLVILLLWGAGPVLDYQSPYLLFALNFLFSTLTSLLIAYLAARSFVARGAPGPLLLGTGVLLWGAAGVVATASGRGDPNLQVTIHNTCAFASALCHLAGALLSLGRGRTLRTPGLWLAVAYVLAVGVVVLVTVFAVAGWMPTFFVQGRGGTPVRQLIIGSAVVMFAVTAGLLFRMHRGAPSRFLWYYSPALALVATGLFGVMIQLAHGSMANWVGRATQWTGGVYMLMAALASARESRAWGISLQYALEASEERYRTLFATMTEACALHELVRDANGEPSDFRFLAVNPAFEKVTGLSVLDVVGRTGKEALSWMESSWTERFIRVALTGEPDHFESYNQSLQRWYHVHAWRTSANQFSVILQDITERKQAEINQLLLTDTLRVLSAGTDLRNVVAETLRILRQRTGFDAVGLRLGNGEDFPYYEHSGFSPEFVALENSLCAKHGDGSLVRDPEGRAVLECTCGCVLSGKAKCDMPSFTSRGSFWTNLSQDLLALPREQDPRTNPRNRCIHLGYQSVGLFPVRAENQIIGLLQLNDRREGRFTPQLVAFYESLAQNIGLALLRIQAQSALRSTEGRLRLAQSHGRVGVWEWEVGTDVLKLEPEMEQLYGVPGGTIRTYVDWAGRVHPDDLPRVERERDSALAAHELFNSEFRIRHESEGERWLAARGSGVYDENGALQRVIGVHIDITDHRRAEDRIRRQNTILEGINTIFRQALTCESEEALGRVCLEVAEAVTGSKFGFLGEVNPQGRLEDIAISNPGWARCGMAQPVGHHTVPSGFQVHGLYGRVLCDGKAFFTNQPSTHPDSIGTPEGHPALESFLGVPLTHDGRTTGLISVANRPGGYRAEDLETLEGIAPAIVQVFLRRRAEQALRDSEHFHRQTLESIPGMVFTTRPDGYCDYQSQQWVDFTGVPMGEHLGDGWNRLLHPEDQPRAFAAWRDAVEDRAPYDLEYRVRRRDGEYEWFKVIGRPIRDGSGSIVRWFGVAANIHELKRAEEALQEAKEQIRQHAVNLEKIVASRTARLHETIAELEHFSYAIIHDLRAPLRAMQGFSALIEDECAGCPRTTSREYFRRIKTGSTRMDQLIADSLNYSKAARQELTLERVDLFQLIDGLVATYPNLQPDKADISVDPQLPAVLGNEAALTQCFSNLLGNAVKFAKPGTMARVRIRGETAERKARIWVEDQGIGIPREAQQRIFAMFQRATAHHEGTGIGLAIVGKVVERMGGRVGVESEEGRGARFWVELPTP